MKRVLIVTSGFGYGGVRAFVMNYYHKVDLSDLVIDIYVLNSLGDSPFEEEVLSLGGKVFYDKEYYTSRKLFHFIFKWYRFLKNNHYDVVHAHCNLVNAWILLAAKFAGIENLISHSHTSEYKNRFPFKKQIYVNLRRALLNKIVSSRLACGKEAGLALYGKGKDFCVIPNSIPYQSFMHINTEKIKCIKEKFQISEKTFVYSNISLFSVVKNQLFVVEIFKHIKEKQPNSKLILAGPVIGSEGLDIFNKVKCRIKEYKLDKDVIILKQIVNMADYYHLTDCWIFPSLHEGLPISLLELQAASVPIVASDTVSKEVDLGLHLITFCSLNDSAKEWAEKVISKRKVLIDSEKIVSAFKKNGYDLDSNAVMLKTFYMK